MTISIIWVTKDRLEYLKQSLESHLSNGSVPHTLMIANNGSTDGTTEWLKEMEPQWKSKYTHIKFRIFHYKKNYGKIRVVNNFFRLCKDNSQYLGVVVDDVVVKSNWVDGLDNILNKFPEIGIVSTHSGRFTKNYIEKDGTRLFTHDEFFFEDDSYLMRSKIIDEMETKLNRDLPAGGNVKSGYFIGNQWHITEPRYYIDIKRLGYTIAVSKDVLKQNLFGIGQENNDKYKRQSILVKRLFLSGRVYQNITGGILTWTENGIKYKRENEPEYEYYTEKVLPTEFIPLSCLDTGVQESDINLFSKKELEDMGWDIRYHVVNNKLVLKEI